MVKKKTQESSSGRTKVLIVDDHWAVVDGIKAALAKHEKFEVAGTASDGLQAVKKVKSLRPDIVIMDISMPNLNGIEAAYEIKKFNKDIRIVIFSMYSDKEYVLSLFRAGISGYVLKEETISDLIVCLESVRGGGIYYSESVQKILQHHMQDLEMGDRETAREIEDGLIRLSIREKEVFPLLADGLNARYI
jgi:DNA-binding NarL/FixJ family response regulator